MVMKMSESRIPTIHMPEATSTELMAEVLRYLLRDSCQRVQILVRRGEGVATINKCRVALSRSRQRNRAKGRKIAHFTLNHSIYPYTDGTGARFDAVVLSIQRRRKHRALELVDNLLERGQLEGGLPNVA